MILSANYDHGNHVLVCTSTNGPATKVSWMKHGQPVDIDETNYQQTQRLIFTVNSTYETRLHIPEVDISILNLDMYECLVKNSRGNDTFQIKGKAVIVVIMTASTVLITTTPISCADKQ